MNYKTILCFLVFLAGGIASKLSAQGTAFLYQGQLNNGGSPANGPYDLRFALFDAGTNGNALSVPQTNLDLAVSNGLFVTTLDFGPVFAGGNYWLSIGVRTNGDTNAFTILSPRQPVLPVPESIFATSASNVLGLVPASQLAGTLSSAQIGGNYTGTVNFSNTTNTFTGNFTGIYSGNGSALTSLNGSQVTTGTVADARLTTNVALLNGSQIFTGVNSFTNRTNAFTGNFFGNGNVAWIPVSGTYTQAVANAGYVLLNTNTTKVMLPPSSSLLVGDVVRISAPGSGGWLASAYPGQSILGNFHSYSNSLWLPSNVGSAGNWHCLASSVSGSPMYAGGNVGSGGVYVSDNNGATWSPIAITGTSWASLACSANGRTVYAAPNPANAGGAFIQRSLDGGVTWQNVFSANDWVAIACSSDGATVIAASTNATSGKGAVYFSSNAGASVITTALPTSARWAAVTCSSDGTRLAAAINGGLIYYFVNNQWFSSGASANWVAMVSSDDGLRLAACTDSTSGGNIYTSTNGGASWALTSAPVAFWNCLAGSADCSRLVAGVNQNVLYGSANFGATWSPLTTTNANWSCIASSADGNKVAAGVNATTGNIYYTGVQQQFTASSNTNSPIGGSQGSAVELLYLGNNQFTTVSSQGVIWAN